MSIEENIERIATALETIAAYVSNPPVIVGGEKPVSKSTAKRLKAQEEPAKEEPAKEEPAKEEPAKEEPAKEEPAKEEPAKEEPTKAAIEKSKDAAKIAEGAKPIIKFSEVRAAFYEVLNSIRNNSKYGPVKAREVGAGLLVEYCGAAKVLDETTLKHELYETFINACKATKNEYANK